MLVENGNKVTDSNKPGQYGLSRRRYPPNRPPPTLENRPMIPAEYLAEPQAMPDRVVYVPGGKYLPSIPLDPDLDSFVTAELVKFGKGGGNQKLPNGLSLRKDIFARLVARGAAGAAAYRAAFKATGEPLEDARRAAITMGDPLVASEVVRYRREAVQRQEQGAVQLQDFVKGSLVREAQLAPEAGARIRAIELLGKTEGMFTDVKRVEKALSPSDLKNLKTQLEQRLRAALHRVAPHLLASQSHGQGADNQNPMGDGAGNLASSGPHPGGTPLNAQGTPQDFSIVTPSSEGSHPITSGPILEMSWSDIAPITDTTPMVDETGPRELLLSDLGL